MHRRWTRHTGLAFVTAITMFAAACASGGSEEPEKVSTGFADCQDKPNDCNKGPTKKGGTLTLAIGKDVKDWNGLSSTGNTLEYNWSTFGLYPRTYVYQADLTIKQNTDLVTDVKVNNSPFSVVYKINPKAVWSDGTPISAKDFVWNWKVQNSKDCAKCPAASTAGYKDIKSVEGSDGDKTVTVSFNKPFPDYKSLFSPLLPAHIAEKQGDLLAGFTYFSKNVPTFSGGPYKIEKFEPNFAVTVVPNDKWYGATKPSLDKVIYRIITKDSELTPALQNREIHAIQPIPTADIVKQVKEVQDVHWRLFPSMSWEHLDFNLKNEFLAAKPLREALFTAVNVKDVIAKTVGQFDPSIKPLGNHNFVPGQPGYKDLVTTSGQGAGDVEKAKKILTDAGYKLDGGKLTTPAGKPVGKLRFVYTTGNQLRKQTGELFQATAKQLGVDIELSATDNLSGTTDSGAYDVIIFAWVGSPLRIGAAQQLWHSTSRSNRMGWVNTDSDKLLDEAATLLDEPKAFELINKSNEILVKDAVVLPLFQRSNFFAVSKNFTNIRGNPTNHGPVYNIAEWGERQ